MLQVGAILVDFDGTACLHDVAEHLLVEFGDPSWPTYDAAVDRGEIGLRTAITAQAGLIRGGFDDLLAFAHEHCPMDPTFGPFVARCREVGVPVTLVSDGFGFYIDPLLRAAEIGGVGVITNTWLDGQVPRVAFGNGHGTCVGCGTCKMRAVLEARAAHGPVAFVGEGQTDRYGALYADVTFAKDALVGWCERDGVPFRPWTDFDDVWRSLAEGEPLPGPVAPDPCPGWVASSV
jgi:2-hydroxy-3-keto-5-methylthiopentenyl-1-phosphate phosphatase